MEEWNGNGEVKTSTFQSEPETKERPRVDLSLVSRAESARSPLSQRNGKFSPSSSAERPSFHSTNVYAASITASDLSKIGTRESQMKQNIGEHVSYRDYGLQNWREYAGLKFGDNERFHKSPHGKSIIIANTLREYQREMRALVDWADEVERTAVDLHAAMTIEKNARIAAETRVIELEAELSKRSLSPTKRTSISIMSVGNEKTPTTGGAGDPLSPWINKRRQSATPRRAPVPAGGGGQTDLEKLEDELIGAAPTPISNHASSGSSPNKTKISLWSKITGGGHKEKEKEIASPPPIISLTHDGMSSADSPESLVNLYDAPTTAGATLAAALAKQHHNNISSELVDSTTTNTNGEVPPKARRKSLMMNVAGVFGFGKHKDKGNKDKDGSFSSQGGSELDASNHSVASTAASATSASVYSHMSVPITTAATKPTQQAHVHAHTSNRNNTYVPFASPAPARGERDIDELAAKIASVLDYPVTSSK